MNIGMLLYEPGRCAYEGIHTKQRACLLLISHRWFWAGGRLVLAAVARACELLS